MLSSPRWARLAKGHYTDWVENPEAYPASGMGGANVGPEFTLEEYLALRDLEAREATLAARPARAGTFTFHGAAERGRHCFGSLDEMAAAGEKGSAFGALAPERQEWLVQTGSRYIWTMPAVVSARRQLYQNLLPVMPDPHAIVVDAIGRAIEKYLRKFNLSGGICFMAVVNASISLSTQGNTDIGEITGSGSRGWWANLACAAGIVTVFCPSSTSGVTTVEYESGCAADLRRMFDELVPSDRPTSTTQTWGDANGYSHMRAPLLLKPSLTIPFINGKLTLGDLAANYLHRF